MIGYDLLTQSGVGLKSVGLVGSKSCLFLLATCFLIGINSRCGSPLCLLGVAPLVGPFAGRSYEEENEGTVY